MVEISVFTNGIAKLLILLVFVVVIIWNEKGPELALHG